jgi:lysophospholipase L1-like esterase
MPLGDSITLGKDANGAPEVGYRVGYRRELFFSLVEAGFNVDFVGSVDEGDLAVPVFDSNHEGHAGFTDNQVGANVYQWLSNNPADVVLLHIGTNNPETSAADVDFILSEIDRFNPAVEVVLAKIINTQSYNPTITTFNNNLESIALARIAAGDKITIVDMESALIAAEDFTDNLHPNTSGYTKMSEVWFEALNGVLPVCTP